MACYSQSTGKDMLALKLVAGINHPSSGSGDMDLETNAEGAEAEGFTRRLVHVNYGPLFGNVQQTYVVGSADRSPRARTSSASLNNENPPASDSRTPGTRLPCKCCRCGGEVDEMYQKFKLLYLKNKIRRRTPQQGSSVADVVPVDSRVMLKFLLRKVIEGFKTLNGKDPKSVIENRKALDRLRRCGFKAEYKLLQMLHTAKLENQSRASSDEISKMFEQIHL